MKHSNSWKYKEDMYLMNNFKETPMDIMEDHLQRTESAIRNRAYKLGLTSSGVLERIVDRQRKLQNKVSGNNGI